MRPRNFRNALLSAQHGTFGEGFPTCRVIFCDDIDNGDGYITLCIGCFYTAVFHSCTTFRLDGLGCAQNSASGKNPEATVGTYATNESVMVLVDRYIS
jgi:hypothetical protein